MSVWCWRATKGVFACHNKNMLRQISIGTLALALLASGQTKAPAPAPRSGFGAPRPAVDLRPGTYNYQAKMEVGGQEVSLNYSTKIQEENGAWSAIDTIETPSGPASEVATIEKRTLLLRKRAVTQGSLKLHIEYANGKATGSVDQNGQITPIDVDLGGPVFGDGPGGPQVMACLPLAPGYTASFRQVDVQKQKAKTVQLKVTGSEKTTVPAGTFDTYRVEIYSDSDAAGMTMWVARPDRKVVKIQAAMPQVGGGVRVTEELLP
jgi:hypothetical protein